MEYTKDFVAMTDVVRSVLASGHFPINDKETMDKYLEDTNDGDRVVAVICFPTIDIELEVFTADGSEPRYAKAGDNEVRLDYYSCIKGVMHTGNVEWASSDFVPRDVNVDFSADDWEEQLTKDMLDALLEYAESNGFSLTEYNFNDC